MKLMRALLSLPLAVAAVYGSAAGQEPARPDSVVRAPPLRVDAVRAAATAGAASALQVLIDSLKIGAAASLEQVMRELPLITVRTNSRGEAQFSMRGSGSDARQVAVLMDGVPLHIGWDDRVDLSVLPAGAATALTIVRGLPSMLHGPNVLGGVVEVAVAQGSAGVRHAPGRTGSADLAFDNTGSYALSAAASARLRATAGDLTVRAGAGHRDRPGFAIPRGLEQPSLRAGTSPLTGEELRSNTDHAQVSGFLAGRYEADAGVWLSLASSAYRAERGIAAELHTETPRFWRYPDARRAVVVASGGTGDRASPLGGRGDVEASIGYDAAHTEIVSYTSGTYRAVEDTEDADDRTLTLRLLGDQTIGGTGELRLALTYVDTRHAELLSGVTRSDYRQRIWSGAAETAWRVPTGLHQLPALRISIGGAFDGADTPESGDKPRLGTLHAWGARAGITSGSRSGELLVHAGISRRARFPALRELYSGALGRFEPNPGLRPETLHAAEAGLTWRPQSLELQGVAFYRRLDRAIEQIALPDGRRQRVNLGAVRSGGIELLGGWTRGAVAISADITLQRVTLSRENQSRRFHPEYQPSVMGGLQTRLDLPLALTMTADARYTGRQYCLNPDGAGELGLAASRRYDMALARAFEPRRGAGFGARVELRAAVDNVLDAAIYDQCGLPQPGRTLRLQLMIR